MFTENRRHECNSVEDLLRECAQLGLYAKQPEWILERRSGEDVDDDDDDAFDDALESTGSMVICHRTRTVFAARSDRTSPRALARLFSRAPQHYDRLVMFDTLSSRGKPFYHTNVMMSIGTHFAVVCTECIVDNELCTRREVVESLRATGRTVIEISLEQAERHFCANILEVRSRTTGQAVIVMSESALLRGFTPAQIDTLRSFGALAPLPISATIEAIGGGSARCMCCEVFLPSVEEVVVAQQSVLLAAEAVVAAEVATRIELVESVAAQCASVAAASSAGEVAATAARQPCAS
jgi:hypothetical protein